VPDTDKDGVNDEEDKCPTVAGLKENNGCPEIKKEIVEKVNKAAGKIQFQTGKSVLLASSYKVLDQVTDILKADPSLKLTIEGHSSKDGSDEFNMKLSQARADEVKKYLLSKGIDAARIDAVGYGSSRPLNESKTAAERALNRRVEMRISNY
jgi:outer membrane protein OmpA-like peptidoglycan-associated protein